MRTLSVLLLVLALSGCTNQPVYTYRADCRVPGSETSIAVLLKQDHPFLAEYGRTLAIVVGDKIRRAENLYIDAGSGSLANLYLSADGTYLLIDMTGSWFRIDPQRTTIQKAGWHWEERPAGEYAGCFTFMEENSDFVFAAARDRAEVSPYRHKDPDGPR